MREEIIAALFDLALPATTFNTSNRRLQLWSKVASFPALFIQSVGTHYPPRDVRGLPPKRTITAELWVYTDVGKDPNANPGRSLKRYHRRSRNSDRATHGRVAFKRLAALCPMLGSKATLNNSPACWTASPKQSSL